MLDKLVFIESMSPVMKYSVCNPERFLGNPEIKHDLKLGPNGAADLYEYILQVKDSWSTDLLSRGSLTFSKPSNVP